LPLTHVLLAVAILVLFQIGELTLCVEHGIFYYILELRFRIRNLIFYPFLVKIMLKMHQKPLGGRAPLVPQTQYRGYFWGGGKKGKEEEEGRGGRKEERVGEVEKGECPPPDFLTTRVIVVKLVILEFYFSFYCPITSVFRLTWLVLWNVSTFTVSIMRTTMDDGGGGGDGGDVCYVSVFSVTPSNNKVTVCRSFTAWNCRNCDKRLSVTGVIISCQTWKRTTWVIRLHRLPQAHCY